MKSTFIIAIFTNKYTHNPKSISKKISSYLNKNNSDVGIGLYGEKRNVYKGKNYVSLLNPNTKRDIHVGIDINGPIGTPCMAFEDGIVSHFGYNPEPGDYGFVIITKHDISGINIFLNSSPWWALTT